jgi:serine/threonine-protein kinase ULK/ATG1
MQPIQKTTSQVLKKVDNFIFDANKPIGQGAFAKVYRATDEKDDKIEVAVKAVPAQKLLESEEQYKLLMREIEILRQIKGEHVVQLIDAKRTSNNLYIFTEYCNEGDLEKKIKSKYAFSETEALVILKSIAHAFVNLNTLELLNSSGHKITVMHRDIKPANILYHNGVIKVADFGFAKVVEEVEKDHKAPHTLLGTPLYMSPQILHGEKYSAKCDVWSTGVLFYQLLYTDLPWKGFSIENLYGNIKTKPLVFNKDKQLKDETKDLVAKMLKIKEEDRLSWEEVYEHEALKSIELNIKKKGE